MDRRVLKTKQALRVALFQLLDTKTMTTITVTELCRAAHIDRRTFYIHYDNITQIFEDYELELSQQVRQALTGSFHNPTILLHTFDHILMANYVGLRLLCLNATHLVLIDKLKTMLFNTMCAALTPPPPPRQVIIIRHICAGLMDTYVYWFKNPDLLTYEQLNQINHEVLQSHLALL